MLPPNPARVRVSLQAGRKPDAEKGQKLARVRTPEKPAHVHAALRQLREPGALAKKEGIGANQEPTYAQLD